MKISVIIPTYRPGEYMRECIASLEGQTLSHADFEVLVVLNGCREPYEEQLRRWLGGSTLQWHLIQTDTPGVSHARNMALDAARGGYITFLDDDDWFSPTYLERLLEGVGQDVPGVTMVKTFDETTGQFGEDYLTQAYHRCASQGEVSLFRGRTFMSTAWGKLLPREVIGDRRFPEQFRLDEDSFFMSTVSDRVKRLRLVPPDAIYYRRLRRGSASRRRQSLVKRLSHAASLTWCYVRLWAGHPLRYSLTFLSTRVAATWYLTFFPEYE
ncbi:MAG: glycosyltransferase family 2 protein [Bacteroidaceae bacterium]|nr:glycosyltransferase family 2 protein [Bacteroidaceae bacterium]